MKKKTAPIKKNTLRRVPRPILAMAAPPSDTPTVTIDRLKGGEYNWSVKAPASTVALAVARAVTEAKALMVACMALETEEREERARQKALAALVTESNKKEKEEGGK